MPGLRNTTQLGADPVWRDASLSEVWLASRCAEVVQVVVGPVLPGSHRAARVWIRCAWLDLSGRRADWVFPGRNGVINDREASAATDADLQLRVPKILTKSFPEILTTYR